MRDGEYTGRTTFFLLLAMNAYIYDSNGMLLYSGLDQAAAFGYAKLFELDRFTLVLHKVRQDCTNGACFAGDFVVEDQS